MYTDVSGSIGYAAVYGLKWFVEYSLDIHANYHIFIKGLFQIVLLNEIFGTHLSNNFFFSDNLAVVEVIIHNKVKTVNDRIHSIMPVILYIKTIYR